METIEPNKDEKDEQKEQPAQSYVQEKIEHTGDYLDEADLLNEMKARLLKPEYFVMICCLPATRPRLEATMNVSERLR